MRRTSEVFDEIGRFHLSLRLDALVVEVGVEHDDGEGEQEDAVERAELRHFRRVALAEARRERLHQPLDLLRFALQE